jgi:hypothetical protein
MANVRRLDAHLRDGKLRQAMREAEAAAKASTTGVGPVAVKSGIAQSTPCGCKGKTTPPATQRCTCGGCRGRGVTSANSTSVTHNQRVKPTVTPPQASARTDISRPRPVPTPPAPIPFEQFLRPRPGPAPAPPNPTPIQACTGQLFPTPFPKPLPLPISQLDPTLPVPIVVDGVEGSSTTSPTTTLGSPLNQIGGTAIIPAGVDVTKVDRVMFWMQGEGLLSTDSEFIDALRPVAQSSESVIIILDSESTDLQTVRDRREQFVKFINAVALNGMRLENGIDLRLDGNPYICVAGWSRGASAAIEVAAGVTTTRLRTGLKVSSVMAVAPTANSLPMAGVLADPKSVLAARERLNDVSAIIVASYADGDTGLDAFWYIPAFGGGMASGVHFTADCANHKRLLALSPPEGTGCLIPGNVWTASKPECGDDDIGRLWLVALSWMIGATVSSKSAWRRLIEQRVAPRSGPGGITVCIIGGGARIPKPVVNVKDAATGAPVPNRRGVGLDFISGLTLFELAKAVCPTVLFKNGLSVCKKLPESGRFGGLAAGRTGTVTAIRPGQSVRLTFRIIGLVGQRVSRVRFSVGAASLGYLGEEPFNPPENPVIQKIPVCVSAGRNEGELTARAYAVISSDPAFSIRRCNAANLDGCGQEVRLRHYGGGFVMQTLTVDIPDFMASGFSMSITAFSADGVILAIGDPEYLS